MPQALSPLIADGATRISHSISVVCENGQWIYFCGAQPVFQHAENDHRGFRGEYLAHAQRAQRVVARDDIWNQVRPSG